MLLKLFYFVSAVSLQTSELVHAGPTLFNDLHLLLAELEVELGDIPLLVKQLSLNIAVVSILLGRSVLRLRFNSPLLHPCQFIIHVC